MKYNNFIITSTNNIEDCPIERYIDTICTNIVVGTNVFSDIAASFTDFFGGFSETYKSKLELIYSKATKELKNKAKHLGANAIIGFRIDYGEVSGGGKSMLMVSVSGTACLVKYKNNSHEQTGKSGIVTQDFIDIELKKRFIIKSINNGEEIETNWKYFLYEYPQKEIVQNLLNRYIDYNYLESEEEFIERYLTLLPKSDIVDNVYSMYQKNNERIGLLIKRCLLFSPKHVLELIKVNKHLAIALLDTKKDFYQEEDLIIMKEIIKVINQLPNTGNFEIVKGGILSKQQEKFICENGHRNKKDVEFCEICGRNIKGLTQDEVTKTRQFIEIVEIIENNL